jgi:pimeloyl-ACP methyl ester carboxylesterase
MSATSSEQASFLPRGDGERLAFVKRDGRAPGIVWMGGFKSDMEGNKARALDAWAARHGRPIVRFDYFGHGRSSGDFRKGTITHWRDDALAVIDSLTSGRQILIGSSMGAWLALLCAMLRPERIAGLFLIAPATDFTETLLWHRLPDDARRAIEENGEWLRPSAYDTEPYPITRTLIEDGRNHLLLDGGPLQLGRPVLILQGMRDPDVPWRHAVTLAETLEGEVTLVLARNGDHRLSTPADLRLLERELGFLVDDLAADIEQP